MFELTPPLAGQTTWTETLIYSFKGGTDGLYPQDGVVLGKAGRLYGTTESGGVFGDAAYANGTVFELTPPHDKQTVWTETLLHSFNASSTDGGGPFAGVIIDKSGNLYGTTFIGGAGNSCDSGIPGCGTVFRLSPPAHGQTLWTESLLSSFYYDGNNLGAPDAPLVFDKSGNLYGTAPGGGNFGSGGIYELINQGSESPWPETTLQSFPAHSNTAFPGLVFYTNKLLYGTTESGGKGACASGCGTVFKLNLRTNVLTTVYNFTDKKQSGEYPLSGVIFDSLGNGYGTTYGGGKTGNGTVFELPSNSPSR